MFGTLPSYLYFDGEAIAKDGLRKDNKNLIFLVAMITFASCGADNIGVFVPPDSASVLACAITIYCGFGVSKIPRQAHE
ncbi:cadmium resistance transporter [Aggregatibacter sp. 2125159857]|uniref:cadmium resistance transporter n=1 Tax=Aggregatibacter sp. 2125159857 TaxID=2820817 RepID=UPI001FD83F7C|nr:cadmium resistance transporter [Aggregatibacter sp. 2125159857]